jgi:hypothetical protein
MPPLVARELLVGARQPRTYWLRLLTALGAVSVLAIVAATGQGRLGRNDGFPLFAGSVVVLFFVASINCLRSTTDCIGAERRQGTLALLVLASLKVNTILVSKLVTNSLRNAWALLGTVPVLGLCLLLGGVSGLMFVQGALAILAAMWLSLMVGLAKSCHNQGEHEAFSHGLRLLIGLNLTPLVSPSSLALSALLGRSWQVYYWMTLCGTISAGFLCWSQAKMALNRNWQEAPPEEGPAGFDPLARPAPAPAGHLKRPARRCGNTPPAYWLFARYGDARQASPQAIGIAFVAAMGFITFLTFFSEEPDMIVISYGIGMAAARLSQMLAMAKIAPQSFAEITRHGALEILQTTPITLKEIVGAACDFLIVHFRRGVLPMLGLDALVLLVMALRTQRDDSGWRLAGLLLAQNSLFLSGLCAMGTTGMWLGLKQRSLTRSSISLVCYFLLLPALLYLVCPGRPVQVTIALVVANCAIAVVMRVVLTRVVRGGDRLNSRLQVREHV